MHATIQFNGTVLQLLEFLNTYGFQDYEAAVVLTSPASKETTEQAAEKAVRWFGDSKIAAIKEFREKTRNPTTGEAILLKDCKLAVEAAAERIGHQWPVY